MKFQEQEKFRCTIMRGGTSKAVFFKRNELPEDTVLRDKIIMGVFGAPDIREIDGLGGADITTSKVAIIGPPTREDADVDYNFGQVQMKDNFIDWNSNCGNISSAVGPYAIDEGMVKAIEPITTIRIHNTNTKKILVARVQVKNGKAKVHGDFVLDGVPGTAAKIELDYKMTFGSATGKLLPTGNPVDMLDVEGLGNIPVSIVDIANSVCFVNSEVLGVKGTEARPDIASNAKLLTDLENIRTAAAIACGFIKPGDNAAKLSPTRPMVAFVSPSVDYADYVSGDIIKKEDVDFLSRIMWNQAPVETYTGTGTICTAVASQIEGTVVNQVCSPRTKETKLVQFGHPRGINRVEVVVSKKEDGFVVDKAVFLRTARRIMDGYVYVKKERIGEE